MPEVIIYQDGNYQGASQQLSPGRYNMADIKIGNDQLSSLKVPAGMKVTIYEHANFAGRTKTFTSDTSWVGNEVNDFASSLIVESAAFRFLDEESQSGDNYNHEDAPASWVTGATRNWMSYLPDTTPLKSISIPGTHDSGALHGGLATQTNSWTIKEQLDAGIRFLDIRTRRTKDSLAIHHGIVFQQQMFGDVMNAVVALLTEQPKETIIMRVKADEHTAEDGSQDFATIWAKYMTQFGNYFAKIKDSNPSLGDVRGKVFLLSNSFSDPERGINYNNDNVFDTQDLYKVWFLLGDGIDWSDNKANLPGKKTVVKDYLNKASTSTKWVRNYLSGSTAMAPSDVARAVNGTAYDHMGANWGKRNTGIVIMDFPGEKLIYRIIKSNFQSTKKQPAKMFRCQSDHSWVEFRLPEGTEGQVIEIPGGAYNHYVFPKCNRVHWDDLRFFCTENGWERTKGNWDADGLCHGSPGSSPYVATGNR